MLIAQVTDTHVTRDGHQARHLADVIAWINAMQPRPDVVLLSGDTVNDGRREQYATLDGVLARCAPTLYLVPGNHDRREVLRSTLSAAYFPGAHGDRLHFAVDAGELRLIGLDSAAYGWPGGVLDDAGLRWLEATLSAAPERPVLLFLHHPPFRTGVNAADVFGFRGLRRLRDIVVRYRAVRRIIAGHIHCERSARIGEALATTALSSIPQQVPEVFERRLLGVRAEPAGFAIHAWRAGAFVTATYVDAGGGRFVERAAG